MVRWLRADRTTLEFKGGNAAKEGKEYLESDSANGGGAEDAKEDLHSESADKTIPKVGDETTSKSGLGATRELCAADGRTATNRESPATGSEVEEDSDAVSVSDNGDETIGAADPSTTSYIEIPSGASFSAYTRPYVSEHSDGHSGVLGVVRVKCPDGSVMSRAWLMGRHEALDISTGSLSGDPPIDMKLHGNSTRVDDDNEDGGRGKEDESTPTSRLEAGKGSVGGKNDEQEILLSIHREPRTIANSTASADDGSRRDFPDENQKMKDTAKDDDGATGGREARRFRVFDGGRNERLLK
jgi:hypothetical protein